jgi:geranylgeranyl diphosphate synthase type I
VEKMESLRIRPQVQGVIDNFLEEQKPLLNKVSPAAGALADFATDFLAGGKRLRAAFCYWGYLGANGEDNVEILKAASALEFLQGCALVHDDVMDASDTRRGQPAIHKRFEQMHSSGNWAGNESLFGVGGAVLLGDLLLSWADQLLMTSGFSGDKLIRAKNIYDTMRTELMAGQYLDLYSQAKRGGSMDEAFNVIRFKSAKYTIERPLHLGCALAVNDQKLMDSYSQYGLPLGEAFQLRDDLLGVFGDPTETGKPAGDDLREGKRTVLMEIAFKKASPAQKQLLDRLFAKPDLALAEVVELRDVIQLTGALAEVEALISERLERSQGALEVSSITDEAKTALFELAIVSTSRRL